MTSQLDARSGPVSIEEWRDKKRYLWLMGLIAPTALFVVLPFVWAFNQFGWHRVAGILLDRPDPALRPAADAGPALRAGRAEPARRGDGAAGERQVLPLLHL